MKVNQNRLRLFRSFYNDPASANHLRVSVLQNLCDRVFLGVWFTWPSWVSVLQCLYGVCVTEASWVSVSQKCTFSAVLSSFLEVFCATKPIILGHLEAILGNLEARIYLIFLDKISSFLYLQCLRGFLSCLLYT